MPIAMRAMMSPRTVPMNSRLDVKTDARSTSAPFRPEEDGPHEVVSFEQVTGDALEPNGTLLEEDRSVGHRQGHVQRLLDDEHRLAVGLQCLDHLEQPLDDD